MKDSVEIYVQPGSMGFHAGVRASSRTWAADKDDPWTAAYKCGLAHWFKKRASQRVLYQEAAAVRVEKIGENEFRAVLELPDKPTMPYELAGHVQPQLFELPPKKAKRTKKTTRRRKARK
jgi:hypothetical protein